MSREQHEDPVLVETAKLLAMSIQGREEDLALSTIRMAGVYEEFEKFWDERRHKPILDVIDEFGRLHPDKFYIPEDANAYGKYIVTS